MTENEKEVRELAEVICGSIGLVRTPDDWRGYTAQARAILRAGWKRGGRDMTLYEACLKSICSMGIEKVKKMSWFGKNHPLPKEQTTTDSEKVK